MRRSTRDVLDKAFSGVGLLALAFMGAALILILAPMMGKGFQAFLFRGTHEYRRLRLEQFERGNRDKLSRQEEAVRKARAPVLDMLEQYRNENVQAAMDAAAAFLQETAATATGEAAEEATDQLEDYREETEVDKKVRELSRFFKRVQRKDPEFAEACAAEIEKFAAGLEGIDEEIEKLSGIRALLRDIVGPLEEESASGVLHDKYGSTRWDWVERRVHELTTKTVMRYPDGGGMGWEEEVPRVEEFRGTALEPLFGYVATHAREMTMPRWTFYWGFLFDPPKDSHFFGGIGPELKGTFMLTVCAILFAVPMGVIAAIYLCEYARPSPFISIVRTCVSTLAGVPSIVFGLFGLAFFLNTLQITETKSVLAGSLTLALMILPTIIRASEEAILAVPLTYKEAALGVGATRWQTIVGVILPAALPGIITGTIISMGRAAGETAPIIFTAAVSIGQPLQLGNLFGGGPSPLTQPTAALPWSVYTMCSEHAHADLIRHNQFGMVFVLVGLVLLLNLTAIIIRARISKKLRG